jgi:hypothetical protein
LQGILDGTKADTVEARAPTPPATTRVIADTHPNFLLEEGRHFISLPIVN